MQSFTVTFGMNHFDTIAGMAGMNRQQLQSCPTVYAGFAAHAIISGCQRLQSWILPTGNIISAMEFGSYSRVTIYDTRVEFDNHMDTYLQYDRAMTLDPETGRRAGLYS